MTLRESLADSGLAAINVFRETYGKHLGKSLQISFED